MAPFDLFPIVATVLNGENSPTTSTMPVGAEIHDSYQKPAIKAFAAAAIKLPFLHLREFFKFSWIPIALTTPLQTLSLLMYRASPKGNAPRACLLVVPGMVIAIPFLVAWIKLSANGTEAVSRRRMFVFSGLECRFLLAGFIIAVVPVLLAILSITFTFWALLLAAVATGFNSSSYIIPVISSPAGAALVVMIPASALYARLSFKLISVALEHHEGWWACWILSRGLVCRLCAIVILASLPFYVGASIVAVSQLLVQSSLWVGPLAVANEVFRYLSSAATIAGLSLVYNATKLGRKAAPENLPLAMADGDTVLDGGANPLGEALIR